MVSTPFGLKFAIVSLCVVDQWVRSPNDLIKKVTNQSGPQHNKNTYSATQCPQYQEIHSLLGLKQSKVFCFLEEGSGIFFILSFSLFFAIIRLLKNTGSSLTNDVFYKASGISACGKSAGCL